MVNPSQPTPAAGLNGNLSAAQRKAQEIMTVASLQQCKFINLTLVLQ